MKNRKRFVSILAGLMAALMILTLILSLLPTRASAASSSEIRKQINELKEQKKEILRTEDTLIQAIYEFYFENQPAKKDNFLKHQFDSLVKVLEKLIEVGVENGEFYCENCKEAARNIMYVLEGMRITAQTIGIKEEMVDREILFILKSLDTNVE